MLNQLRDPFSGLSHLAGALLSICGLVVLVYCAAVYQGKFTYVFSSAVFGVSLLLLYTASAIYHLLPLSPRGIGVLRRIDHMMIFVLIAGTYTPICLIPLRGAWGYTLLAGEWLLAIGGFFLKIFCMQAPRWLSTLIYVLMGWLVAVAFWPLLQTVPAGGVFWLVLGGVFYTAGAVLYAIKWPDIIPGRLGFHEIFHLFIMAGSICHFRLVMKYIVLA